MSLRLEIDQSPADFLRLASPFLEREASLHSMLLSLADRYHKSGAPLHLMARGVDENGECQIAGIQTEHYRALILSRGSPEHSAFLARALAKQGATLAGVNGPIPSADEFAQAWSAEKHCPQKLISNLRLFELTKVIEPRPAPGAFRRARAEDEKLIFSFYRAFHDEAVPHDPVQSEKSLTENIREGTANGHYFLWEDGGEVTCLVASRRETARERWIAPVYTPPRFRGRGYASCLVAEASRWILGGGKVAMLFTNLANPTSNSIYRKVGYAPLADFRHWQFGD